MNIAHIDRYAKSRVPPRDTDQRYRLELRSLPSEIPPEIRLRRLLKALLRQYAFRVTDYRLDAPAATASGMAAVVEGREAQ